MVFFQNFTLVPITSPFIWFNTKSFFLCTLYTIFWCSKVVTFTYPNIISIYGKVTSNTWLFPFWINCTFLSLHSLLMLNITIACGWSNESMLLSITIQLVKFLKYMFSSFVRNVNRTVNLQLFEQSFLFLIFFAGTNLWPFINKRFSGLLCLFSFYIIPLFLFPSLLSCSFLNTTPKIISHCLHNIRQPTCYHLFYISPNWSPSITSSSDRMLSNSLSSLLLFSIVTLLIMLLSSS